MYPGAWKLVEEFRRDKGVDLPDWPAWCFLPMSGFYAIVSADAGVNTLPLQLVGDVARLSAIGTWRYTQGIYRFDDTAAAALSTTLLHGEMPVDVFMRLPEWCVYIEAQGLQWDGQAVYGYWCHLEWDANTGRRELRLLLDTDSELLPLILHLGSWTVTEAIDRFAVEAKRQATAAGIAQPATPPSGVEDISAQIQPFLALVLYICSDEPEIDDPEYPSEKPARPRPKKTKRGWRLFAPDKPRIWSVADTLGENLRRNHVEGGSLTGRSLRPHVRRAHWHGFWTGPREGERKFHYKWLPPMLVSSGR